MLGVQAYMVNAPQPPYTSLTQAHMHACMNTAQLPLYNHPTPPATPPLHTHTFVACNICYIHVCMYSCMCIHMCVFMCVYSCVRIHVCVCVCVCVHVCVCVCVFTYVIVIAVVLQLRNRRERCTQPVCSRGTGGGICRDTTLYRVGLLFCSFVGSFVRLFVGWFVCLFVCCCFSFFVEPTMNIRIVPWVS